MRNKIIQRIQFLPKTEFKAVHAVLYQFTHEEGLNTMREIGRQLSSNSSDKVIDAIFTIVNSHFNVVDVLDQSGKILNSRFRGREHYYLKRLKDPNDLQDLVPKEVSDANRTDEFFFLGIQRFKETIQQVLKDPDWAS